MCSSRNELKQREKEMVNETLLADPLNMNLKYGGDGGGQIWSKEHAKLFSVAGNSSPKRDRYAAAAKSAKTRMLLGIKGADFVWNQLSWKC